MNDYEDAEYFTAAFPSLFPYGRGRHIPASDERSIPVSLEAWAKWSLSHHAGGHQTYREDTCKHFRRLSMERKRPARKRTGSDIDFTVNHPEHGEKTQIVCDPSSVARAVTLVGQLSQYQHIEDRVQGGHPETLAMQNDLAAILLALFVPWEKPPGLSNDVLSDECCANCDKSSHGFTGIRFHMGTGRAYLTATYARFRPER